MARKSVTITRKPGAAGSQDSKLDGNQAENVVPHPRTASTYQSSVNTLPDRNKKSFAPFRYCGKAVYGAAYGVSYGVVFGALIVGMLIPGGRVIGQAMLDASGAARKDFSSMSRKVGQETTASLTA